MISQAITIRCDVGGCDQTFVSTTAYDQGEARGDAWEAGWDSYSFDGDFCPAHKAARS
jgi:hypothetical protein